MRNEMAYFKMPSAGQEFLSAYLQKVKGNLICIYRAMQEHDANAGNKSTFSYLLMACRTQISAQFRQYLEEVFSSEHCQEDEQMNNARVFLEELNHVIWQTLPAAHELYAKNLLELDDAQKSKLFAELSIKCDQLLSTVITEGLENLARDSVSKLF